jgi:hypothetical protein
MAPSWGSFRNVNENNYFWVIVGLIIFNMICKPNSKLEGWGLTQTGLGHKQVELFDPFNKKGSFIDQFD